MSSCRSQATETVEGGVDAAKKAADAGSPPDGGNGDGGASPISSPFPAAPYALTFSATPQILSNSFAAITAQPKFKGLRFALIDLTDTQPVYLGNNDVIQTFIASTAKIAVMYAALELRKAVQNNMRSVAGVDGDAKLKQLEAIWATSPKPYPNRSGGPWPPRLSNIFEPTAATNGAWKVDFRSDHDFREPNRTKSLNTIATLHDKPSLVNLKFRDRMELMIGWSDNNATATCINDMGFQYLNGVLAAAGFYDKKAKATDGGGLWIGSNYGTFPGLSSRFQPNDGIDYQGITNQGSTAQVLARYMALVASKTLVDATASDEILIMTDRSYARTVTGFNTRWIRDELENKGRNVIEVHAKVGFTSGFWSTAAYIIENRNGKVLKYVIACSFSPTQQTLKDLAVELSDAIATAHP
jgi:Beta-lactamase enzyme family